MNPYTREQTRELLAEMFLHEISEEFLDAIYKVTEGNLFFIEEICKALIEEGKLYCQNGQWHFSGIEELELPQSVRIALEVRINRLPSNAQDLLRMAAVIGREFDYQVLRLACEQQNEDALIEALELAERAQLINEVHTPGRNGHREAVDRFAFAHGLIPATLREDLSSLRRHRIHRRVAAAIEVVHPDDLEGLAYHYGQAGDQEKARFYTIRAGDRARKLYANNEALRFYSEALRLTPDDHADRFHILQSRARVYNVLAQRDAQRTDIEAMVELAENLNDDTMRCDALIALSDFFLVTENVLSREPARRAVEIAGRLADPVREGHALRCVGWGAWIRHDYHESLSALESAVARFRQAGMLAQAAECLHMLSLVTGMQGLGELEVSKKFVEDAIHLSRLAGDPRQESISLRRLAIVHMDQLEHEKALEIAQQALGLHRELGDRYEECMAINAIGVILCWMERHEEAFQYLSQAFEMSKTIGSNMGIWITYANILYMHYRREGMYEEGLAFADQQLNNPDFQKDPFLAMNMTRSKADLLTRLGQYPAVLELLGKVRQLAEPFAGPQMFTDLYTTIALVYAEMRQFANARQALEEARSFSRKLERSNDAALLLTTEAEIARREWEDGNLQQIRRGASLIEQSLALLRGTHWMFDLGYTLQTAAWIALARNQPETALEYAKEASQILSKHPVPPEVFDYVTVCALWANGRDQEANTILERVYQRVMLVANNLKDEELRRSWLEDVLINRQIVDDWVNYHGL